jgi:hypothetical protein
VLRTLCATHGDHEWPDDVHWADILNTHPGRYLETDHESIELPRCSGREDPRPREPGPFACHLCTSGGAQPLSRWHRSASEHSAGRRPVQGTWYQGDGMDDLWLSFFVAGALLVGEICLLWACA